MPTKNADCKREKAPRRVWQRQGLSCVLVLCCAVLEAGRARDLPELYTIGAALSGEPVGWRHNTLSTSDALEMHEHIINHSDARQFLSIHRHLCSGRGAVWPGTSARVREPYLEVGRSHAFTKEQREICLADGRCICRPLFIGVNCMHNIFEDEEYTSISTRAEIMYLAMAVPGTCRRRARSASTPTGKRRHPRSVPACASGSVAPGTAATSCARGSATSAWARSSTTRRRPWRWRALKKNLKAEMKRVVDR